MTQWTQKEATLLKELQEQEKLCVEKYGQYAGRASDPELRLLFDNIRQMEVQHYDTLTTLLENGQLPQQNQQGQQGQQNQQNQQIMPPPSASSGPMSAGSAVDQYLCMDALSTEKYVSGSYDTSIFEFCDPSVRQALNGIQTAEQRHGEMLYGYMARHGIAGNA